MSAEPSDLGTLLTRIRACRLCVEAPLRAPLPHAPRPVIRASASARLWIAGQAPGARVHESGIPFNDPSGDRLRGWLGIDRDTFYDESRIAIVPMGFCFPGLDAQGGDRPPRRECARTWHAQVFRLLPDIELMLLVGTHAQAWHLGACAKPTLAETVADWRAYGPRFLPLPHPSWRNNAWLKRNPWFETQVLPHLRRRVRSLLNRPPGEGEGRRA